MSATGSENQGNSRFASLLSDSQLLYGVQRIRKSLAYAAMACSRAYGLPKAVRR